MNKVIVIFLSLVILTSCVTQNKTVQLANGKYVTEKTYNKMIKKAMTDAKKTACKKTGMSKKQLKSFEEKTIVNTNK